MRKKKSLLIILVLVLIGIGVFYLARSNSKEESFDELNASFDANTKKLSEINKTLDTIDEYLYLVKEVEGVKSPADGE